MLLCFRWICTCNLYAHVQCVTFTLFLLDVSDSPPPLRCYFVSVRLSDSPPCVQCVILFLSDLSDSPRRV